MSVGTAFHKRTAKLNVRTAWREWSGYLAADLYADAPDIEYNAIREAAALIDVSPLYKYIVSGGDAARLIDRVITRDARKIEPDSVIYACWCDERGRVLDDGTVARLDDGTFRWTAADPSLRWFRMNAAGLDVDIRDVTEEVAAVALQGPRSRDVLEAATREPWADVRYFGRRPGTIGRTRVDVTRTGYTGDLGYEIWVPAESAPRVWDALMRSGRDFGLRPAGMLALDIVRVEAGLILIEVDFESSRRAMSKEQSFSPFEIGLGRLVDFDKDQFVGRGALLAEREAGGPPRRLAGLRVDWDAIVAMYAAHGLPPIAPAATSRQPVPLYRRGRRAGRATSTTWSPTLKSMIALASVGRDQAAAGTTLEMEWTVEARRGRVPATVAALPFFDPPRKRS